MSGINPNQQQSGLYFNPNGQDKTASNEPVPPSSDVASPTDPYAAQKKDPNYILNLMAQEAQLKIPVHTQAENHSIQDSIAAFTNAVSQNDHQQATNFMSDAFVQEFGVKPSPSLLQEIVDNYLIGKVSIQNS